MASHASKNGANLDPLTQAAARKEQGNAHFAARRWDAAVEAYSQGLASLRQLDSSPPHALNAEAANSATELRVVLLSNRAAAHLRLGSPGSLKSAAEDCVVALGLRPGHEKSLYRRAEALRRLGKPAEALADAQELCRRYPGNPGGPTLLRELLEMLDSPQGVQNGAEKAAGKPKVAAATGAAKSLSADRKKSKEQQPASPQPGKQQTSTPKGSVSAKETILRGSASAAVVSEKPGVQQQPQQQQHQQQLSKPDHAHNNDANSVQHSQNPQSGVSIGGSNGSQDDKDVLAAEHVSDDSAAEAAEAVEDAQRFPVPRTGFDFLRAYLELKEHRVRLGRYIMAIPPGRLPALVCANFDSEMLRRLVDACLAVNAHPTQLVRRMVSLTKVPRFDLVSMFPDAEERAVYAAAIERLRSATAANSAGSGSDGSGSGLGLESGSGISEAVSSSSSSSSSSFLSSKSSSKSSSSSKSFRPSKSSSKSSSKSLKRAGNKNQRRDSSEDGDDSDADADSGVGSGDANCGDAASGGGGAVDPGLVERLRQLYLGDGGADGDGNDE